MNIASWIILITGVLTAATVFQFLFPRLFLKKLCKIELQDDAGLFFARHWGVVVFVIGLLLIFSAFNSEYQTPIIIAALVEKVALIFMVLISQGKAFGKGLLGAAIFDTTCSILYFLILMGIL